MLQTTGMVVKILPVTTYGKENKQKGGLVIETDGKYPKKIAFTAFGTTLAKLDNVGIGFDVNVHFAVESREWNDKWFTDVVLLSIEPAKGLEKTEKKADPAIHSDLPF